MAHVRAFPRTFEGEGDTPEFLHRDRPVWHSADFAMRPRGGMEGTAPRFRRVAELRVNTRKTCVYTMAVKLQNNAACSEKFTAEPLGTTRRAFVRIAASRRSSVAKRWMRK